MQEIIASQNLLQVILKDQVQAKVKGKYKGVFLWQMQPTTK